MYDSYQEGTDGSLEILGKIPDESDRSGRSIFQESVFG